jgi:hypothetical protein
MWQGSIQPTEPKHRLKKLYAENDHDDSHQILARELAIDSRRVS